MRMLNLFFLLKALGLILFTFFTFLFLSTIVYADEMGALATLLPFLSGNVMAVAEKYPVIVKIFFYLGVVRHFMKPLMSLAVTYVQFTPSKSDNEWLDKVVKNKIYKVVAYLLDWSVSVKLPKEKKE